MDNREYVSKVREFSSRESWSREVSLILFTLRGLVRTSEAIPQFGLDFGCGVGKATRLMGAFVSKAVGFDINVTMLEEARENCPRCEFYADHRFMNVSPGYSMVLAHHSLAHVPNYEAELLDLNLSMVPGGVIAVATPNARYSWWMGLYNKMAGYKHDPTIRHWWTAKTLSADLEHAGFVVRHVMYLGETPKFLPFLGSSSRSRLVVFAEKV